MQWHTTLFYWRKGKNAEVNFTETAIKYPKIFPFHEEAMHAKECFSGCDTTAPRNIYMFSYMHTTPLLIER